MGALRRLAQQDEIEWTAVLLVLAGPALPLAVLALGIGIGLLMLGLAVWCVGEVLSFAVEGAVVSIRKRPRRQAAQLESAIPRADEPPRLALALLYLLADRKDRPVLEGDLLEGMRTLPPLLFPDSRSRRVWYWFQVLDSLAPLLLVRLNRAMKISGTLLAILILLSRLFR